MRWWLLVGTTTTGAKEMFWRSEFPFVAHDDTRTADFAILDKEGWDEGSYLRGDSGSALRHVGTTPLRTAVAMVAAGKASYKQLSIAVAQDVRERGYGGDILVYLGDEQRHVVGCVATELTKMGVQVRPFSSLFQGFPYPKKPQRSPAWHKLGLAWNLEIRQKYDRILYLDTDQYIDLNVTALLHRDLPEATAIGMCPIQCTRVAVSGREMAGRIPKTIPCGIDCARGLTPRPPPSHVFPETCDNIGFGDRGALKKSGKLHDFFTHFPRKNLAYQSGLFLLDLTKLPSPDMTRQAATTIFDHFPAVWVAFGDQEFFNNLFYDVVSLIPECMLHPPAFRHIFHSNVDAAVAGKTSFQSAMMHKRNKSDTASEFRDLYFNATGLTSPCHGPATEIVQASKAFRPESLVCFGDAGCLRPVEFNNNRSMADTIFRRPFSHDDKNHENPCCRCDDTIDKCTSTCGGEAFFITHLLPYTNGSTFVEISGGLTSSQTFYLEHCQHWRGLVIEKEPQMFNAIRRHRPDVVAIRATGCQRHGGPLKHKAPAHQPPHFCEAIGAYLEDLRLDHVGLLAIHEKEALAILKTIDLNRVAVIALHYDDDQRLRYYLSQHHFTLAARHCSGATTACITYYYSPSFFDADAFKLTYPYQTTSTTTTTTTPQCKVGICSRSL